LKKKFPFPKKFCRVPFRARRREINKIVFAALARIHPLHFAPTGAKSNKIVFAALARVAKTPRLKRLGRCRQ